MTSKQFLHDVFISHSKSDYSWVRTELLPKLNKLGLSFIDQHSISAGFKLEKVEQAVEKSRWVLLIISSQYLLEDWKQFEAVLSVTKGITEGWSTIPVFISSHENDLVPKAIQALVSINLSDPDEDEWDHLLQMLMAGGIKAKEEERPKRLIKIIYNGNFLSMNETRQKVFIGLLARLLHIDSDQLKIMQLLSGNALELSMPFDAANHLLAMVKEYNFNLTKETGIIDAIDLSGLPYSNHNLPPHQNFIDRKKEKARVIEGLVSGASLIKIDGLGGMGKTVLAIEVGYDCLPNGMARLLHPFSYCIFISAKTNVITLDDLINVIARELYYPYIYQNTPYSDKPFEIRKLLKSNRVLIIVDNLETVTDKSLLDFIQNIPDPSRVIVTTRQTDIPINAAWTVHLPSLKKPDAIRLIKDEAKAHGINSVSKVNEVLLKKLIDKTGGNPFAIKIIVANMKDAGWTVDRIIKNLENGRGVEKIFEEIYPSTWEFLSTAAQNLLLAVSFFSDNANGAALKAITNLNDDSYDQSISQLIKRSLIETNEAVDEFSQRFSMHPLTIAFVKKKLGELGGWENDARRKWAKWFLNFAIENKGDDWWVGYLDNHEFLDKEWKNLLAVFEWCKEKGLFFDLIREFWLDENVSEYIKTYGHWNDRLYWLEWIMDNAKEENRKDDYIASVGGIIWTLTRMGAINQLEKAEVLSKVAWKQCEGVNPAILSKCADDIAVLCSRLKKWKEAKDWFKVAQELLDRSDVDSMTHYRRECHILYYQADLEQRIGNSEEAKILYKKGLQLAIAGKWQRAVIFFKYRLSYTAISQNLLTEDVEEYLFSGLAAAQNTKNTRATALYKMTIAKIEKQRGNINNCQKNGEEALNIFMRLGMQEERLEVEQLLSN